MTQADKQRAAEWQPIETAPRDGTSVLLGYFHRNLDGSIYQEGGGPVVASWLRDSWSTPYTKLNSSGPFSPTHWQPCPPIPEEIEEETP